jgi:hypothetical protein
MIVLDLWQGQKHCAKTRTEALRDEKPSELFSITGICGLPLFP